MVRFAEYREQGRPRGRKDQQRSTGSFKYYTDKIGAMEDDIEAMEEEQKKTNSLLEEQIIELRKLVLHLASQSDENIEEEDIDA